MLAPLLALTAVAAPLPQNCVQDLPRPTGNVFQLGNQLAASADYVVGSDNTFGNEQVHIWSQSLPGDFALDVSIDTGASVEGVSAVGDSVAAVLRVGSDTEVVVWRRNPAGAWLPDPAILPPTPGGDFSGTLALDGGRLLARDQGPRLWVFERDDALGTWSFVQTIDNPPTPGFFFGVSAQLEGDRIAAIAGDFTDGAIEIYERDASGQYLHAATLSPGQDIVDLSLDGERLVLARETEAEVWRRRPNGTWTRDEVLDAPGIKRLIDVALDGRWIALAGLGRTWTFDVPRPILTYERVGAGQNWIRRSSLAPEGGIGGFESAYGIDLEFTGGHVLATEPGLTAPGSPVLEGRIAAFGIDCIEPLPVVQWVPASIRSANQVSFPSTYGPTVISTGLAIQPGPPLGVRDAQLVLDADFDLSITGLPCDDDYPTSICTFFAHSMRETVTGLVTDPYPLDPNGGVPQVFSTGNGPLIPGSQTTTQVSWPFALTSNATNFFSIEPTGQPLELELAGTTYNCIDVTGQWFQADPDVQAFPFNCFFESVPSSVQSLDFEFGYDALVAFELPGLGAANQATICAGQPNSVGAGAVLEAQGSADVTDNQLFLAGTQLPPGEAGLVFLAAAAATPPFQSLGQGELCIEAPLVRLTSSLAVIDGAGNYTTQVDLAGLPQGTVILPGSTWYLQLAYRDANPQGTTNTSSAIEITFD